MYCMSCCSGCSNGSSDCVVPCNVCTACIDAVVTNSSEHNVTGCRYNCSHNVSSPGCPPGSCRTDVPLVDIETVKYLVLAAICILATGLCGCCWYRRGLSTNRERQGREDAESQAGEDEGEARTCQHTARDTEEETGPVIVHL
ncbi:uncharacterized protein LOC124275680 [Haliotis rubra]|uniref:uncharacterized protein LOC124275680 n=1 Tax=Haliotis rubra TaxID=36100 RepID=UPI001EE554C8|nr:uncharacterized protein LOC124275680 [Haliotis rubra]